MIQIINKNRPQNTITVSEMKNGDTGVIVDCPYAGYTGWVIYKFEDSFVSLNSPSYWSKEELTSLDKDRFKVRLVDLDILVKERA